MPKILLVEDDLLLARAVVDWLKHERHTVEHTADGGEALHLMKGFPYDLIILDWELPVKCGIDVLKEFRRSGGTACVIFLTSKGELEDKESGLDAGADDYLTKPFHMKELSARIRALLRRPTDIVAGDTLSVSDLVLDTKTLRVTRAGVDVQLQPVEFSILEFLLRHKNEVFNAETLLARVWKSESEATPGALRVCLNRLRKKLNDTGEQSLIENIHGCGYTIRDA